MIFTQPKYTLFFLSLLVLLLIGCSSGTSQTKQPTPATSPTPVQAQQLLQNTAHQLNTAKTLHSIFNLTISGQAINGTTSNEVWNEQPSKSRSVVLQSTVPQIPPNAITVNNGQQLWQYNPQKKVVYNGYIPADSNGTTSMGRQNQLMDLARNVFTQSTGTSGSSTSINGHDTYTVHVVSRNNTSSESNASDYEGDVYIDKTTQLPVRIKLAIQSVGQVQIDFTSLTLNQPVPPQIFTFTIPAGVKVLPLPANSASGSSGALNLNQAQQQAGYHLLSIPSNQPGYTLQSITALGAPGNQIYTLNYLKGAVNLTIAEGKPLANLPAGGQQVNLRGTTGTLSNENGSTTLSWTENGVGIRISGQLNGQQLADVAQLLT